MKKAFLMVTVVLILAITGCSGPRYKSFVLHYAETANKNESKDERAEKTTKVNRSVLVDQQAGKVYYFYGDHLKELRK